VLDGVIIGEYTCTVKKLRLKEIREARNLSLRELSGKAGVGLATLVRLEAGAFDPRLSTLFKLSRALRVSISKLIVEKNVKKKGGTGHGIN
jgi:transcriptional regulator with XRE-family HTH domain